MQLNINTGIAPYQPRSQGLSSYRPPQPPPPPAGNEVGTHLAPYYINNLVLSWLTETLTSLIGVLFRLIKVYCSVVQFLYLASTSAQFSSAILKCPLEDDPQ